MITNRMLAVVAAIGILTYLVLAAMAFHTTGT